MNEKIMEIAHVVSKIPAAKLILKPIYYPIKDFAVKMQKRRFQKNALPALRIFDECMTNNSIPYTLIFGSLLGAIREKGIIRHDLDIDVSVPIENRNPILYDTLNRHGFTLKHRYIVDNGKFGCEETYEFKNTGVTIDIFYICPPIDTLPYCCCWNLCGDTVTPSESMRKYGYVIPRRIELPFSFNFVRVPFENIEVNIDENADQISEYTYGVNYMTPDPNYIVPTAHRVIWTEKKAIYEVF